MYRTPCIFQVGFHIYHYILLLTSLYVINYILNDVYGAGSIRGLQWSSDSELLAVHLASEVPSGRQGEGNEPLTQGESHSLQVWQRSNWHWYLKQEWRHGRCGGLMMQWSEAGNALTTCSRGGTISTVSLQC